MMIGGEKKCTWHSFRFLPIGLYEVSCVDFFLEVFISALHRCPHAGTESVKKILHEYVVTRFFKRCVNHGASKHQHIDVCDVDYTSHATCSMYQFLFLDFLWATCQYIVFLLYMHILSKIFVHAYANTKIGYHTLMFTCKFIV